MGGRGALRLVVRVRFDAHASARPMLPTRAVASCRHGRYQPLRAPHPPPPSPLEYKWRRGDLRLDAFKPEYFTCKVFLLTLDRHESLAPPLPFVLKGEGVGGEGRAAACSTRPLRCEHASARPVLPTQAVASYRHGRYQPLRAPHPPTPSPLEYKGEGETFD